MHEQLLLALNKDFDGVIEATKKSAKQQEVHVNYDKKIMKVASEGLDILATRLTPNKPGYGGYTLKIENKRKVLKQAKMLVITNSTPIVSAANGPI